MAKAKKKVFITHHLDEKGRKYAALVASFLAPHNIQTVTATDVHGRLSDKVRELIESSPLVIALLTPDVEIGEGRYQPSQWCIQEITWAIAHDVPCILVVEEGVEFDGGITGDLTQIRFLPGDFASALERVINQTIALLSSLVVPPDLPDETLSDRVWRLIVEGRAAGDKGHNDTLLRFSEEALELDRNAWPAAINKAVALVKLGRLTAAEQVLLNVLRSFDDNAQAKALANHNLGWRVQVKNAGEPRNVEGLQEEAAFYEAALLAMHAQTNTRASLIQCKVLLGQLTEASQLLMQSLKYRGFLEALRYETENRGYLGHQILRQLPESEWLYPLLFPVWQAAYDELREHEHLIGANQPTREENVMKKTFAKAMVILAMILTLPLTTWASGVLG